MIDKLTESDKGRKVVLETYSDRCYGRIVSWDEDRVTVDFTRQELPSGEKYRLAPGPPVWVDAIHLSFC